MDIMSSERPLRKYSSRPLGVIRGSGDTKHAPLPNFFERTVQHEAQIYCRYWFDEDYSISISTVKETLLEFERRPSNTIGIIVNTHRNETVLEHPIKFIEYMETAVGEPTSVFLLNAPRYHLQSIFLWIFRGPSPEEGGLTEAERKRMSEALNVDESYAVHPDQLANDMYDVFGQTKMGEGIIYYFGRSVPTKYTKWMAQAEAPKYYKHVSEP